MPPALGRHWQLGGSPHHGAPSPPAKAWLHSGQLTFSSWQRNGQSYQPHDLVPVPATKS